MVFGAIIQQNANLKAEVRENRLNAIKKIFQDFDGKVSVLNELAISFHHSDKDKFDNALKEVSQQFSKDEIYILNERDENGKIVKGKFKPYVRRSKEIHRRSSGPKDENENEVSYFTVGDIMKIYQFPPPKGLGLPIGIISLGGSVLASDLSTYWTTTLGIPEDEQACFRIVPISGASYTWGEDPDADAENTIDATIAGGIARGSRVTMYSAPNTDMGFYRAINRAIKDQNKIISISWGSSENNWNNQTLLAYNSLFQWAVETYQVNIFVASGDNGSSDGQSDSLPHVDFPSSSPWTIACGGTTLICPSRIFLSPTTKETAWSWYPNSESGTGGGISSIFPAQPFQSTIIPYGLCTPLTNRGVPDIAFNADPSTPWIIYFGGYNQYFGGTSCVAPLMAGLTSRIQMIHWLPPLIYQSNAPKIFHDVTTGSTSFYSAGKGYDLTTGLGSFNASMFQRLTSGSPIP